MYRIEGTIEGIAPILFNAPDLDMLKPAGTQRQKTEEERDEESLKRAYVDSRGLYLPSWNFKKCLLNGVQTLDLRVPGSKLKRLWRFIQPVLFVEEDLLFGIKTPDFIKGKPAECFLHKVPGRNADGSATIVRRPALKAGWKLPFSISILDDLVREEDVHVSLIAAGERVGLGGWRPEYGRFQVTRWGVSGATKAPAKRAKAAVK